MVAAICSDCHTPHRNLPADDRRSSVHPQNLVQTCGRCHAQVNTEFVTFDPHSKPGDPTRSLQIYLARAFMIGTLVGVFGLFSIHNLLWLQRTLVGVMRGEYRAKRTGNGPYVRRFARVHIWTHIVVVLSFLALAATGLPLKFHAAPWAPLLVGVFGGHGPPSTGD
jgi:hypothetical protein